MLCMLGAVVDGGMDAGRRKKEDVIRKKEDVIRKKEDNLDQRWKTLCQKVCGVEDW
jgi:hypothetical protein